MRNINSNNSTTQKMTFLLLRVAAVALLLLMSSSHVAPATAAEGNTTAVVCTGKRLVILAGPRRSATTSVAEFFYKYARGAQPDRSHGKIYHPLANFRWPLVYGEVSNQTEIERPYKRFNHLVTDPGNTALKEEILGAIKRDWNIPGVDAIILGGEEFEQVEMNSWAISAVYDIVDAVGASPECVTILLNYRVPRFEHWVSLYSSLTMEESAAGNVDGNGRRVLEDTDDDDDDDDDDNTTDDDDDDDDDDDGTDDDDDDDDDDGTDDDDDDDDDGTDDDDHTTGGILPYEQHMCQDEDGTALRLQELGTTMNPMYLAEMYLQAENGWNVQMIDMGGVLEFGTDVSHVIGCQILGGKCDDDGRWVKGHIEETITNKVLKKDFESLPIMEIALSEQLFTYRDCAYQEDFQNKYSDRFHVVMNHTIWADCNHGGEFDSIYQSLRSPEDGTRLVFDALLSQVDCGGGEDTIGIPIEDVLSGAYIAKQKKDKKKRKKDKKKNKKKNKKKTNPLAVSGGDDMENDIDYVINSSTSTWSLVTIGLLICGIGGYALHVKRSNSNSNSNINSIHSTNSNRSRIEMKGVGGGVGGGNKQQNHRQQRRNSTSNTGSTTAGGYARTLSLSEMKGVAKGGGGNKRPHRKQPRRASLPVSSGSSFANDTTFASLSMNEYKDDLSIVYSDDDGDDLFSDDDDDGLFHSDDDSTTNNNKIEVAKKGLGGILGLFRKNSEKNVHAAGIPASSIHSSPFRDAVIPDDNDINDDSIDDEVYYEDDDGYQGDII